MRHRIAHVLLLAASFSLVSGIASQVLLAEAQTCEQKLQQVRAHLVDALAVIDGGGDPPPPPPPPPPGTPPPKDAGPELALAGVFLTGSPATADWIIEFGRLPAKNWSKLEISYRVRAGEWDPRDERKSHVLLWAQPTKWPAMLGYAMVQRDPGKNFGARVRFRSNAAAEGNGQVAQERALRVNTGDWLRVTLTATAAAVAMSVRNETSGASAEGGWPLRAGMLETKASPRALLGMGTFETSAGPEARLYGWEFSDLAVRWSQ